MTNHESVFKHSHKYKVNKDIKYNFIKYIKLLSIMEELKNFKVVFSGDAVDYHKMMMIMYESFNYNKRETFIKLSNKLKKSTYDYLVNPNDEEYSIIHFVDDAEQIEWGKRGWNLWIVINLDDELKAFYPSDGCALIQTAVGDWGCDHHFLSEGEINMFVEFFTKGNYELNNTKNKWYK